MTFYFLSLTSVDTSCKWIHIFLWFCDRVISLIIKTLRLILQHVLLFPLFLRLNYIPLWMPHLGYPFICWWTLGLLLLFALVVNAAMNMSVPIFVPVPAFNLLCMYADVKLVDHTLILYLSFWRTAILFFTETLFFYFTPSMVNNTSVYRSTQFCLFIYPLEDFCIVLPVGYCEQCGCQYTCTPVISSLGYISRMVLLNNILIIYLYCKCGLPWW